MCKAGRFGSTNVIAHGTSREAPVISREKKRRG
jgi:hypothetical protein